MPADPHPAVSIPPAADSALVRRTGVRGFLWGAGSTTALLLLGFFAYPSGKPRQAGGSITGDTPTSGGGAARPEEAQIRTALARNSNDVDAHLALARLLLARRDLTGAWNETQRVLERAPGNPQALAFQALVHLATGRANVAIELLERAVATDPNLSDGYAYMALVYVRMGRVRDAETVIAEASKRFPDKAAGLRRLLADVQERQGAGADAGAAPGQAGPPVGAGTAGGGGSDARMAKPPTTQPPSR